MLDKQIVQQYYDEHITGKLRDYVYGNARAEAAYKSLTACLPQRVDNILEIGTGIGHVAERLAISYPAAQIYGFDISQKSIECAEKLFRQTNLHFVQADTLMAWDAPKGILFNVIFLMDVYEHIPLHEREGVHRFIREHLAPHGILFLACPTPAFLEWLKLNDPVRIQPVDENIDQQALLALAKETGTRLMCYQEKSIWYSGDYFHALLGNAPFNTVKQFNRAEKFQVGHIGLQWNRIKRKLKRSNTDAVKYAIQVKRNMVEQTIGIKI